MIVTTVCPCRAVGNAVRWAKGREGKPSRKSGKRQLPQLKLSWLKLVKACQGRCELCGLPEVGEMRCVVPGECGFDVRVEGAGAGKLDGKGTSTSKEVGDAAVKATEEGDKTAGLVATICANQIDALVASLAAIPVEKGCKTRKLAREIAWTALAAIEDYMDVNGLDAEDTDDDLGASDSDGDY